MRRKCPPSRCGSSTYQYESMLIKRVVRDNNWRMYDTFQNSLCLPLQAIVKAVIEAIQDPNSTLFSLLVARFRISEMPERHSTRTAYESMLRHWIEPRWSNFPVSAIRTADLE